MLLSQDFPALQVIKLEQNYRSSGRILKAANILIANNPHVFEKRLFSELGYGAELKVLSANNEDHEAERVAGELIAHHFINKTNYKDYAILYRGNHQSRVFEKMLMQNRIPYKISGGTSFFSRPEIKDLLAYLRVLTNPDDDSAFLRIVNTPKREIGPATLQKLGEWAMGRNKGLFTASFDMGLSQTLTGRGYESLTRFTHWLREIQQLAEREPVNAVRDLIRGIDYESWLYETSPSPKAAEMRMKNVNQLFTWMTEMLEGSEIDEPMTLTQVVTRFTLRDMMERGESDEELDQVQLMTLHASKGLEFPYVYLVGMEEGLLPHQSSIDEDNVDEERRLAYVGITRAQKELTFTLCKERRQYGELVRPEPSRFLLELPQDDLIWEQARKTITPEERMQKGQANVANIRAMLAKAKKSLASQAINCCQAAEKGITSISEGSILAVGKARIPHRRKPVASIMMPPQAVKSAIIDGLINAMIKVAAKNRITKTISWGIKITVMIYPSVEAKIAAVKKSRIDLVSRMVGSPVIPSVKAPKMPVPLAQNRISTAIN